MKIVRQSEAQTHKNSDRCTAIEYPIGDQDINGAVIELNGRYPDAGRVVNLECKELVYVIKGSGKLVVEGNAIELNEGDMVVIEPKEKYFFDGQMTFLAPCAPAWHPEQHIEVE